MLPWLLIQDAMCLPDSEAVGIACCIPTSPTKVTSL